ncbi:MAG: polysaccharide deacetylase family protein [Cyanobacteria bacterium P01_A01_bin.135]
MSSPLSVPRQLVSALSTISPNAIFAKATTEKVIALTIDDVPTPCQPDYASTQRILEAIAQYNGALPSSAYRAHATFFVIGSYLTHGSSILQQMLAQGHELGNHGMFDHTHASLPLTTLADELKAAHQLLTKDTGTCLQWFRPGRGMYNRQVIDAVGQLRPWGYRSQVALASMVPLDTRPQFESPAFTFSYVSQFVFPGAILVLHGGSEGRDRNTAAVLQQLLPWLKSKGYRAVTLSQLFSPLA